MAKSKDLARLHGLVTPVAQPVKSAAVAETVPVAVSQGVEFRGSFALERKQDRYALEAPELIGMVTRESPWRP
jgi:hypothetical protein